MTVQDWSNLRQKKQPTAEQKEQIVPQIELEPQQESTTEKEPEQKEADAPTVQQPQMQDEEINPFDFSDDDVNAVDCVQELTHSDKNNPIKAILKETAGITAVQLHRQYAKTVLGKNSKTAKFDRWLAKYIYLHSMGYKGKRAEQAFETLKSQLQAEFQIEKSTGDKLMGK